jgi:tRNA1Val (adenine37-N6)-methyltransferase
VFQFKKFTVIQEKAAMKVGTDAVLLGAWTPIKNYANSILDVGTGTGIIALMLAQRCEATQIDALEIEQEAYEEAVQNFENSHWNDRLFCYHASVRDMIEYPDCEYDLIVCNPPFYSENYPSPNEQRNLARFQEAMPFEDLIELSDLLLSENGNLCVIIPYTEVEKFCTIALQYKLYPEKITNIKGTPASDFKRSLLCFGRKKTEGFTPDTIVIELERHDYTPEYIALTKDFYLKM